MPWDVEFYEPIVVPGAEQLKTLADARDYVLALPAKERKKAHWEVVAQTLMVEGASSTPHTMLTDMALRRALAGSKPERKPNDERKRKKAATTPKDRSGQV